MYRDIINQMWIIWTICGRPHIAYSLLYNADTDSICYYSPVKHGNDSIDVSQIYRIETAENGRYTAIESAKLPPVEPSNVIDCEIKTYLALSWSKESSFVLYLPTFLDVCTKSDINRILNMIKQFSGAPADDIDKLIFTNETVLTSSAKKYSKIREWIFNNKIYQEYFGTAAAEELASGENTTLYMFEKTIYDHRNSKKQHCVISHDFPMFAIKQDYISCLYLISRIFGKYLKGYKSASAPAFITDDYIKNAVMYICDMSGKVIEEYRIVQLDEAAETIDLFADNAVINCKKPAKKTVFDLKSEEPAIIEIYNKMVTAQNAAAAADTSADTAPAPVADEITATAQDTAAAADMPAAPADDTAADTIQAAADMPAADTAPDVTIIYLPPLVSLRRSPLPDISAPAADDIPPAALKDTAADISQKPLFTICPYNANKSPLKSFCSMVYNLPPAALLSSYGRPCCIICPRMISRFGYRISRRRPGVLLTHPAAAYIPPPIPCRLIYLSVFIYPRPPT